MTDRYELDQHRPDKDFWVVYDTVEVNYPFTGTYEECTDFVRHTIRGASIMTVYTKEIYDGDGRSTIEGVYSSLEAAQEGEKWLFVEEVWIEEDANDRWYYYVIAPHVLKGEA